MSYELTIEPLGQTIEVEDGQTILDAALRAVFICRMLVATVYVQLVKFKWSMVKWSMVRHLLLP